MSERDIFIGALQRDDPAERRAYLEASCGTDAALRRRVDGLLEVYGRADSFLEEPARPPTGTAAYGPSAAGETAPGPEGAVVIAGRYKLLEVIGEGGMGTVWLAEQTEPVRRKVAVKLIKAGMDSRQVLARFEAERQALALMDHPNIAKVHDAGTTPDGRPYFVMELVKGVPVTRYCDDHHLTPRERLELFVAVCQAVQHAHQKGVIHRDLKPSNVLVAPYDGKPVVKVIDFGVAKAAGQPLTEKTLFTGLGAVVGTPEYMSPEQAELNNADVDTRSDVFSLGVLLYELLTGSTPLTRKRLKEAALLEVLRLVREEEPPRPSTRLSTAEGLPSIAACRGLEPRKLSGVVRGELDWIVMKCLEKDRIRRYQTANAFAADVQRYLAGEAVQAVPPSASYRFRKFARRNRRALVTASAIGLAFLLAVGSLGWMLRDRQAGRVRTGVEVNQFLQRGESFYDDNKLPEAVAEVQKARGVLEAGSGDEELGHRVRRWLIDLDTAARLEEIRLESFDLEDRDRGDADYERVFRDYGIDVDALSVEEATARVAASQIRLDLVVALGNWASRLQFDPRVQDPTRWQRLRAISWAADPDPWRQRLRAAAEARDVRSLRELADGADPAHLRARTLAYLGDSLRVAGDAEAAVAFLRKAQRHHPGDFLINSNLATCLSALKPLPWGEVIAFRRAALAVRPRSAWAHNALGVALKKHGRLDEAAAEYREAVRLSPRYTYAHAHLGMVLSEQKKFDEAIDCFRTAIALLPKNTLAHNNLGLALKAQGKLDEAADCYKAAIALDPNYFAAHYNLGNTLHTQKKLDEAIAALRKAAELDSKHPHAHNNLGLALRDRKKPVEAVVCFTTAIALDPTFAHAHANLGLALQDQNKLDAAIAYYKAAIVLDPRLAGAHSNLGIALSKQGKHEEAIACCKTAIELDPNHAEGHNNLGIALLERGNLDDAIATYKRAIELDPMHVEAHYNLGNARRRQKKLHEAVACYRAAIALDPNYALAHGALGRCYYDQKKLAEAIASYARAIALDPNKAWFHVNLGNALDDHGRPEAAIASYERAIALDRKDAEAHRDLGIALRKQKKLDASAASLKTAAGLDPKDPRAAFLVGLTMLDQNNLVDAIDWCKKAIALDPMHADAHNVVGIALKRQNKLDEAVVEYRKAIALDPNNFQFHYNLGLAYHALNKPDDAIAAYREVIRLKPDSVNGYYNLGVVLVARGKVDDATAAFRETIRLKPDYALAHYHLGGVLRRQGKVDEAISARREAVRLQPGDAGMRTGLGWVLAGAGRVEEAIACYSEVIRLNQNHAPAHANFAWLLATGPDPKHWDGKRAVELITRAAELTGKDATYWRTLGAAHYRAGDWKQSLAALQKSVELRQGGDGFDWFFLAMAHWQSGDKADAQAWYCKAIEWTDKHASKDEEFRRARAEAAKMLGVAVEVAPLPRLKK